MNTPNKVFRISDATFKQLKKLKKQNNSETWDDFFKKLIKQLCKS